MSRKYKKNVIMVVLDTHRFDRIGAYGYQRPTTPNLDSIASESLFFERAVAPDCVSHKIQIAAFN